MRVGVTAMDGERWERGLTYATFKDAMSRNRERLEANERRVVIDEETRAFFRGLSPHRVLVLAEDWCGDVIANLPVLGRLAEECGTLDVRVFYRDQNLDLIDRWLNQGTYRSIPVFVLLDRDFRELGHWIERPASVTELRARMRREVYASDPAFGSPDAPADQLPEDARLRLQAALQRMRDETTSFANAEVLRELRELASVTAGP